MQTLRKMISRYMQRVSLILALIILIVVFGVQTLEAQEQAKDRAYSTFSQIAQILVENQKDLMETESSYRETCLHNAQSIAYIIESNPEVLNSLEELRKIAIFSEVDEIHIFDKTGRIVNGTHPEYYNYTFDSGEQIGFFKPLLEDKSLKLCQDITPNTAEEKLMQYSALWSENEEFIVQVGMEPINVMRVTEKNELSYIFSLLKVNVGVSFYAIDAETGEIIGSSSSDDLGKNLTEIGLTLDALKNDSNGFHATVNGVDSFCVFTTYGSNLIGRIVSNDTLYAQIPGNVAGLTLCVMLIVTVLVYAVSKYMNRYVVDGIYTTNETLRCIAKGNLETQVDVHTSQEFAELSRHINEMLKSIIDSNKKMSYVLSKTNMYMGIYEHNKHMKKVRYTEYIPQILGLSNEEIEHLAQDHGRFAAHIDQIRQNPVPGEDGLFVITSPKEIYVKLEEISDNNEVFGVLIDVTDETLKRKQAEVERDFDALTGLYNRRGIELKIAALFMEPDKLNYGALIMIDADGLKEINDTYGHEKGDIYLRKIGNIINGFGINKAEAARLGGDEFVLFLYEYTSEEELLNTIETLRYIQYNSTVQLEKDIIVPLQFSFGCTLTKGRNDYQVMLKESDDKMYANKRERKMASMPTDS